MQIVSDCNIVLALATLILLPLLQLPASAYVMRPESQQLTGLLADARDEAQRLANDAEDTQMLVLSDENWITHSMMLARVKGHVDNMALIIEKLSKAQQSGSELQEQVIGQMLPLVQELSANTTAAFNYLNKNKSRPVSDSYVRYLQKNADTARELASIISSLLDYEQSMAEIEQLRRSLTGSGSPTQ